MADFRDLLATFKEATEQKQDYSRVLNKNGNSETTISIDNENTKETDRKIVSKDRVERLWQISNIRRCTVMSCSSTSTLKNPTKSDDETEKMKPGGDAQVRVHIAVCVIMIDHLPHEHVWKRWMESGGTCTKDDAEESQEKNHHYYINASADLYIHAKFPERIKSSWVSERTLSHSFRPDWNDVRVVRAMLAATEKALRDDRTTHVVYCTESCIPIISLSDLAKKVILCEEGNGKPYVNMNQSFVDAYNNSSARRTRFDELSCWGKLESTIPSDAIWKALPGWCLLSRKHAQSVIDLPMSLGGRDMELWPLFEDVWAPEEVFFPTALALCGHLPGPDVVFEALTHSKWNERANDDRDRAHPMVYDGQFTKRLLNIIRSGGVGCCFMRKLKQSLDVETWERIVLGIDECDNHSFAQESQSVVYNRHPDSRKRSRQHGNRYNDYRWDDDNYSREQNRSNRYNTVRRRGGDRNESYRRHR